jgi:hypothetical protein
MDILNIQRYDSSNEEEDDNEKENERASLKKKRKNDYKYYKKKKKIKINNNCFITILYIFIYTLIAFILIFFILKLRASSSFPFSGKNKNLNLRKIDKENNSKIESTKIFNKSEQSDLIMTENINIIEDIKNIDIPPLYLIKDIIDEQISIKNKTKKKIKLAFNYYNLHANGIGRFIAVTANNLIKTGKYDICFITEKPPSPGEFEYDSRIKRFVSNNNYTIIQNITKNENIDIVVLQNVLSENVARFYQRLGQKVICMFHGVFLSTIIHNIIEHYKLWNQFDSCDSFIFIAADDYYIYKNLGFKNEIFMPNLYTFEPSEIKSSNLTNKNIVILGRLNDEIKGIIYAIQSMYYIIKEVPDAIMNLYSSDSRIQFLRNLTRDLNLTKNVIFKSSVSNVSVAFYENSIHMFTSLSEAFPMAMNEGKAHGLPIVGFEVPYSLPYQQGFIGVEMFDVKGLARETVKLLKDYNYRKKMGDIAKKSLDVFKNNETVELWGKLCDSLMSEDRNDYRKFQKEIEDKYYDEKKAREHLEGQFNIFLNRNINLTCHKFENFLDINYLKNIKPCNFTNNTKNSG